MRGYNINLLKKNFKKLIGFLFVLLQLLQPFSQVSAVSTSQIEDGLQIIQAAQTSEQTISVDLVMTNASSEQHQDEIVLSEGLTADEVTGEAITNQDTQKEIGSYEVKGNVLTIFSEPDLPTTKVSLTLKFQTIKTNQVNSLTLGGNVTEIKTLESDSVPLKPIVNNESVDSSASSTTENQTGSTSPSSGQSIDSKSVLKSFVATPLVGNNISQYLPTESNGTIITGATLSFTDSQGNPVDSSKVNQNTNLSFDYHWAISNDLADNYQVQAGDYFTFQLPAGITYRSGTGSLGDFGTYSISTNGTVTFTFNDSVTNYDTITGDFQYTSKVDNNGTTGKETIVIDSSTGPITFPIVVQPTGGNDISKTGKLTGVNGSNNNPTGITWDVTINTSGQELNDATVSDPMPLGNNGAVPTTLTKVTIYPLTVNLSGSIIATGAALKEDSDYTLDANGKITFIGQYADTYQAFKIEYTSTIDSSKIPDDGGQVTFTNKATLSNNDKDSNAQATVNASYGKLLAKSYVGADNSGSQKYNWSIQYNYGEKSLPAGTFLTDTLSADQAFSGVPTLTYEDGTAVPDSAYNVSYNDSNTIMTVTFGQGLSKGIKISYQSQVIGPIGDSGKTISNNVSSNGQNASSGDQHVGSQGLTKTLGNVNYNAKTLTWNFDINKARQDMTNWSMVDLVPVGLTVNYSTFVLKDIDTNTTLTNGQDYVVTPNGNGFTIVFIGTLAVHAKDRYSLSYSTNFEIYSLPSNGTWTNLATATWTDQSGITQTNNGSADFTPKLEFKNDGSKSGAYNAITKQITWTVVGNYNQRVLHNASIVDPIIGDQDFVAGTAKLYEATINSNGSYTLGSQVMVANITFDTSSKTITAVLPEGSTKAYVLTYQTSLAGRVIDQDPYANTATYTNNVVSTSLTASVTVPNGGNTIDKTGQQDPNNSAYADWNIWVNKAQSVIDNAVITDTPSNNQIIDQASIAIYPTTVATNGTFAEDTAHPLTLGNDYTVDLQTDNTTGTQVLKITFTNEIITAYSIHYRALINSSKINDSLSNTASITGDGEKDISSNSSGTTAVVNSGGSATGKNTNIVLTKTDKDSGLVLPGATFELWSDVSGQKGQELRIATTDASGQLNWGNLKSGKYIILETSAPEGYVISPDLANGQEIKLDYSAADDNNNVQIKESNQQG